MNVFIKFATTINCSEDGWLITSTLFHSLFVFLIKQIVLTKVKTRVHEQDQRESATLFGGNMRLCYIEKM